MPDQLQVFKQSVTGLDYALNGDIQIHHPTLGEICDFGERQYYSMAMSLTCGPSSYKAFLWDCGIDWNEMGDWEFFMAVCQNLPVGRTRLLLGDLDLQSLKAARSKETGEEVLVRQAGGAWEAVLDRALYLSMADYIRKMHGFEKQADKTADAHTKKYLVERERRRIERCRGDKEKSVLKPLVASMVNHPGFKYDYATVWGLPVSAFHESVRRVQKYLHYAQAMAGAYAGTVDLKKINRDELDWLNE